MKPRRVLFYLEPVTYSDSPLRLGGWWNFFSTFAIKSAGYFTSQIAASNSICDLGSSAFSEQHRLDQIALLRCFDFDREAYSRDLCFGLGYRNRALIERLISIKNAFQPDIVISTTDNRYLQKVFGKTHVMFTELGPLPRSGLKQSIYIDPFGHQVGSALDWFARSSWTKTAIKDFHDVWRTRWVEPTTRDAHSSGITPWLAEATRGKKIMLAALQPRDWITYEGIGPRLDPVSLLRKLAHEVDEGWAVIPQWHGSDMPPLEALMKELVELQPNIISPPAKFRMANSEALLPSVDCVATVSSNVAAAAVLLGKDLKILGRSKFYKFALPRYSVRPRPDILAFLSCRYCRPLDEFLTLEGAFAEHILRLNRNPRWLFDQDGISVSTLDNFFIPDSI